MVEPENIKLGPGKLYVHTPEGTQPLGSITESSALEPEWADDCQTVIKATREATFTAELIITPEVKEAFEVMRTAATQAIRTMSEWVQACANEYYSRVIGPMRDFCTWFAAYTWAETAHPEWVGILNRTKKRRTRKKYQDRIMRGYLEAMNRGEHQRTN